MQRCCHFTWLMCWGKFLIIIHRFKGQTDLSILITDKWNWNVLRNANRYYLLIIRTSTLIYSTYFDLLIAGFTTIQSQSRECFKLFVLSVLLFWATNRLFGNFLTKGGAWKYACRYPRCCNVWFVCRRWHWTIRILE